MAPSPDPIFPGTGRWDARLDASPPDPIALGDGPAGLPPLIIRSLRQRVAQGRCLAEASDAERQRIADRLHLAVGEGRLTLEEFSDRVGSAYAARTHGELERLVTDRPATTGQSAIAVDAQRVPAASTPAPLDIKIGAIKKLGRWRLKKDNAMGVAIGPIKLDLRGADLAAREITLSARTVDRAIKVWVPDGVRVEVEGTTAVGTRTVAESNLPPDLDLPTLRLRLDTVLATVKVYRTGDHSRNTSFGWHQA